MATITGTVKNIGTKDFSSSEGQQFIYLYEKPLGGTATPLLSLPFTNLAAGDSLFVTYTRNWDASSPVEGEFPPDYILSIMYDPDITTDGNENNDDVNNDNNSLTKSGSTINDLFSN